MNRPTEWYYVLLVFFALITATQAQDATVPDDRRAVVELKNGSKVEGEILDWQIGEYILLKMPWGAETRIDQYRINKVYQLSALRPIDKPYTFKETGLYYAGKIHVIAGNNGQRANGVFGLGFSASAGYRFHRLLAVGGGIGYDRFIWDSGENLIPLFTEVTGFLGQKNHSLFYNVQLGYAWASADTDRLLIEASGGFMAYPNVGLRWGTRDIFYTLSAGYKFQHAEFTYRDAWNASERSEQDVLFQRLTIGFGITL